MVVIICFENVYVICVCWLNCIVLYISNGAKWLYNGNQQEPTLVYSICDLRSDGYLFLIEFVRCWDLDVSVVYGTWDVWSFWILRNGGCFMYEDYIYVFFGEFRNIENFWCYLYKDKLWKARFQFRGKGKTCCCLILILLVDAFIEWSSFFINHKWIVDFTVIEILIYILDWYLCDNPCVLDAFYRENRCTMPVLLACFNCSVFRLFYLLDSSQFYSNLLDLF